MGEEVDRAGGETGVSLIGVGDGRAQLRLGAGTYRRHSTASA